MRSVPAAALMTVLSALAWSWAESTPPTTASATSAANTPAPTAAPATAAPATAAPVPASGASSADNEAAARHAKRTACINQARAKKLVGAQKTAYIKACIGAA